jgi:excisionase family DNA binding protein
MLTTRQLAQELNVSQQTIRNYANAGLLPFSETLGGHRRFVLADVKQAMRRAQARTLGNATAPEAVMEPIRVRGGSRRRISRASIHEAARPSRAATAEIPFVGTRGSSRFIVGTGARTR